MHKIFGAELILLETLVSYRKRLTHVLTGGKEMILLLENFRRVESSPVIFDDELVRMHNSNSPRHIMFPTYIICIFLKQ